MYNKIDQIEQKYFKEKVLNTYLADPNKSQRQIAEELNTTISRVANSMSYNFTFRKYLSTQRELNSTYRANSYKCKSLCAQMEHLISEIKRNEDNYQYVSLNHNKGELERVRRELGELWDKQLELKEKINTV